MLTKIAINYFNHQLIAIKEINRRAAAVSSKAKLIIKNQGECHANYLNSASLHHPTLTQYAHPNFCLYMLFHSLDSFSPISATFLK